MHKPNRRGINDVFLGHPDQSALNHFLIDSTWDDEELIRVRYWFVKVRLEELGLGDGILVLDDTISHHMGKHMEGAGWHHDASEGKSVWGHQLVTSHYVKQWLSVPLDFRIYIKEEQAGGIQDECRTRHGTRRASGEARDPLLVRRLRHLVLQRGFRVLLRGAGKGLDGNLQILLQVMQGKPGPCRDMVLLNAAAAIVVGGKAHNLREGISIAAGAIDSGRAYMKVVQLIESTGGDVSNLKMLEGSF